MNFFSKKILVIVGTVLLIVLIAGALYWRLVYLKGDQQVLDNQNISYENVEDETINTNIEPPAVNVGEDAGALDTQESPRVRYLRISETALSEMDISPCRELETEERFNCEDKVYKALFDESPDVEICKKMHKKGLAEQCFTDVAVDKMDKSICDLISDSLKQDLCVEKIVLVEVESNPSYESCSGFLTKSSRLGCYINRLYTQYDEPSDCDGVDGGGEQEQLCKDIVFLKQAYLANDISLCENIIDEGLRGYCDGTREYFIDVNANFDRDGDGLSLGLERKYGTSDDNEDSDGDGYLDGVEVEHGYDPLGPGRLEED